MAISILNSACTVFGIRSGDTPRYEVLEREGNKEVRSYAPLVVAKTIVKGNFEDGQNQAFRILAGYIFGGNQKKQEISMTSPVMQERQSQKISMTTPVMQTPAAEGWSMSFVMPAQFKLADLPTPNDPRVALEEVPAKTFAVIRYTGLGREGTNTEMAAELSAWLAQKSKYTIVSSPGYAGYDPPWTIPFLRRNEMMIEVRELNAP